MHDFRTHFLGLKHLFLELLCTMASISSIEKDSIATNQDFVKDFTLACKIRNQIHANFEKRQVLHTVNGNFAKKWLFCKTYVLHNICSFICGQKKTSSK